jgi:aspartyl protease family protein
MKHTFRWLGITTTAMLICLEAASVEARTQHSLSTNSVPNVEQLAQLGRFPRRPAMMNQGGFRVPIRGRRGGIPVIDVTFNGEQTFQMLVDTGASITTITPDMAKAIGFKPQGKEKIRTSSGEVVEMLTGSISSIEVGGAQSNNFTVLVGGVPLLGQNFFSKYNVMIGQDFIVFRQKLR